MFIKRVIQKGFKEDKERQNPNSLLPSDHFFSWFDYRYLEPPPCECVLDDGTKCINLHKRKLHKKCIDNLYGQRAQIEKRDDPIDQFIHIEE